MKARATPRHGRKVLWGADLDQAHFLLVERAAERLRRRAPTSTRAPRSNTRIRWSGGAIRLANDNVGCRWRNSRAGPALSQWRLSGKSPPERRANRSTPSSCLRSFERHVCWKRRCGPWDSRTAGTHGVAPTHGIAVALGKSPRDRRNPMDRRDRRRAWDRHNSWGRRIAVHIAEACGSARSAQSAIIVHVQSLPSRSGVGSGSVRGRSRADLVECVRTATLCRG